MATREEIREEQRSLNEANAGKVDADGNEFVPLVVDGIVGPLTRAARSFEPAFIPGPDWYDDLNFQEDGLTPEEKAAQNSQEIVHRLLEIVVCHCLRASS